MLPFRHTIVAASVVLVVASGWAATRLPSTFFPEIDESMERVYVRLAPGTSLQDASRVINAMGATLERKLGKELVSLVLTNVGSPNNARSAMTSPNQGPHMGFIRLALVDPERSQAESAADRRPDAGDPGARLPRDRASAMARRSGGERVRERIHRAGRGRGPGRQPGGARRAGEGRGGGGARRFRACATSTRRCEMDYPEIRVDTDRRRAGWSA